MKITPAPNVIFAFFGFCVAWAAVHYAKSLGVPVPDDMADALPGGIAVAIAHGWDMATGGNKPPQ